MASPSRELRQIFAEALDSAIKGLYPDADLTMEQIMVSITAPKREFGDLSSSIPLRLAKIARKSPADIARLLGDALTKDGIKNIKCVGGYVNSTIDEVAYARNVMEAVEKEGNGYGGSNVGEGRVALVEYPAVNPNKPWHIGHLRNALLGDAISNILESCSYKVEREDYIDDLGLQVAESLWGFMHMNGTPHGKFDQWLGEQYVEVNKRMASAEVKEAVSKMLKRMERGGTEESETGRELATKCVMAQYDTAYAYGIFHDMMVWESDIVRAKLLDKTLDIGMRTGVLEKQTSGKNSGCIILKLDKIRDFAKDFENPNETEKVLVRSDGTATYVAKDIAFHMWKLGIIDAGFKYHEMMKQENGRELYSTGSKGKDMEFGNADIVVNVIGSAQRYPQLIVKAVIGLMGYKKKADGIFHLSYGEVSVEGGSLSGREGGWMGTEKAYTADVLLDEVRKKAFEATEGSKRIENRARIPMIAESIGKAAIKFEFLKVSAEKKVMFSWKDALSFDGNSGPYCMYAYARASKILSKGGYKQGGRHDYGGITREEDFELLKLIAEAAETVERAASDHATNIIADYIIDLTTAFSRFYEKMHVLNSDEKEFRMALVNAYMITLKNMLRLLGIDVVEEM